MRLLRRIRAFRPVLLGLGLALALVVSPAIAIAQTVGAADLSPMQALVPWAVGLLGMLNVIIWKLTRDVERDITDVKGKHQTRLDGLDESLRQLRSDIDHSIAEVRSDFRALSERHLGLSDGIGPRIEASRHKVSNDLTVSMMRTDDAAKVRDEELGARIREVAAECLARDSALADRLQFLERQRMEANSAGGR